MPRTFNEKVLLKYGKGMFREKEDEETIEAYREAVADNAEKYDPIGAHEIRTATPWDQWTDEQFLELVKKNPKLLQSNKMMINRGLSILGEVVKIPIEW